MSTTTMSVIVEEEEADDIGSQAKTSDNQHQHWMRHLLRFEESLYRIEEDGEAQGHKEDTVDQRTERLSTLPL